MISSLPLTSALSPVSDIASGSVRIPVDGAQDTDLRLQNANALFATVLDASQGETRAPEGEATPPPHMVPVPDAATKPGTVVPPIGKSVPETPDEQVARFAVLTLPAAEPQPSAKPVVVSDAAQPAPTAQPNKAIIDDLKVVTHPGEAAPISDHDAELETAPLGRSSQVVSKSDVPSTHTPAGDARPVISREARRETNSLSGKIVEDSAALVNGEPRATEAKSDTSRAVQSPVAATPDPGVAIRGAKLSKLEITEEGKARPARPVRGGELAAAAPTTASQSAAPPTTAPASLDSIATPISPATAAPTAPPQSTSLAQPTETRSELRALPQIEQAIEQMTEAREAGRSSRPELLLRHAEFGAVSMRLDASGGDLRATLASRDPGFVPAIQAALNERVIAPSSESATTNNQRGQDQQSGSNSSAWLGGSGGGFEQRYGSSPGSSEGPLQPRMEQQGSATRELDETDRANASRNSPDRGGNGVFA
ncbi:MAG: hypothetical protein AAF250_07220 [Pseudomonadota bacterium]